MVMTAASLFQFEPDSFGIQVHSNQNQSSRRHHQGQPYQRPERHHKQQNQRLSQSFSRFPTTFHPRNQTEAHQQHFPEQQQRLVEMTDNEVNAWSVHQGGSSSSQGSSSNNGWAHQSQEFIENVENFPIENIFDTPIQNISYDSRARQITTPKYDGTLAESFLPASYRRDFPAQQSFDTTHQLANVYQRPVEKLNNFYAEYALDSQDLFAGMSSESTPPSYTYQATAGSNMLQVSSNTATVATRTANASRNMSQSARMPLRSHIHDQTLYNTYQAPMSSIEHPLEYFHMRNTNNSSNEASWNSTEYFGASSSINNNREQLIYGLHQTPSDSLSSFQTQTPIHSWNAISSSVGSKWEGESMATTLSHTISPKALSKNPSLSLSPSKSRSAESLALSDHSNFHDENWEPEPAPISERRLSTLRPRRNLPDTVPVAAINRIVPVMPNSEYSTSRRQSIRKCDFNEVRTTISSKTSTHQTPRKPQQPSTPKAPKRIEPKPTLSNSSSSAKLAAHSRTPKDEYLVKQKLAGMSYKDIRRNGGFTEAESTLRGRFRTLTKNKSARVRKPEWSDNDNQLLKKAVRKLSDTTKGKIPWKRVADYIFDNGGSYHFGNATCRKHWDDMESWP